MTKQIVCPVCNGYGFVSVCGENSISAYTCDHCNGAGEIEIPMTNADRIRAMSDEELEPTIFALKLGYAPWCDHHCKNEGEDGCDACILKWLKQPAEVDNA